LLKEEISLLLSENESLTSNDFEIPNSEHPYVIMVVGVNGVGKTTTIGKLANHV
jgi:fused signal recognition particle receptor